MKTPHMASRRSRRRAYTLVEALVGSSVLMIGIGAAASLSLGLVTQEKINERSARACNHLDNVAALYHLGIEPDDIPLLLPEEPIVTSIQFDTSRLDVTGLGEIELVRAVLHFRPTPAATANQSTTRDWTGGDAGVQRSIGVDLFRSRLSRAPAP